MDITTLAAWGEFLGGIAVVVSLVYLAGQIRQNSKLLRASTTASTSQLMLDQNEAIIQDADVARFYFEGMADPNALSESDKRRFDMLIHNQLHVAAQQYEFVRDAVGSTQVWDQQERGLRWQVQQPGIRQWWREFSEVCFGTEFIDYVNGLIREGEAAG
jgi:hypothetical protein